MKARPIQKSQRNCWNITVLNYSTYIFSIWISEKKNLLKEKETKVELLKKLPSRYAFCALIAGLHSSLCTIFNYLYEKLIWVWRSKHKRQFGETGRGKSEEAHWWNDHHCGKRGKSWKMIFSTWRLQVVCYEKIFL